MFPELTAVERERRGPEHVERPGSHSRVVTPGDATKEITIGWAGSRLPARQHFWLK